MTYMLQLEGEGEIYDLKAKNIITSALDMDEYFRVSDCKNTK